MSKIWDMHWNYWPYMWTRDRKTMAHYKLWIDWFVNPIYKTKGFEMNEQVNKLAELPPWEGENQLKNKDKVVQTAEDRGEGAVEVKPPLPPM